MLERPYCCKQNNKASKEFFSPQKHLFSDIDPIHILPQAGDIYRNFANLVVFVLYCMRN